MKRINATFEVHNELQEQQIVNKLESLNCKYLSILGNTEHLKDDKTYDALYKAKKKADANYRGYVTNNKQ